MLILNITITNLRSYRIRDLVETKFLKILLYYSSIRFLAWIMPFRLEEPFSAYALKKLINKDGWGSSISTIIITRLGDYLIIFLMFFLVLITYLFSRENFFLGLGSFFFIIFMLNFIYLKRNKATSIIINTVKFLFTYLPENLATEKIRVFMNDSSTIIRMYLNKNRFWLTTSLIAIMQIFITCILIFGSSDNSIDIELFIIVLMYILLQAIPLRLFFGVGVFDVAVLVSGYFTTIGFSVDELILFRSLMFFIIITEISFVLLIYTFRNILKKISSYVI